MTTEPTSPIPASPNTMDITKVDAHLREALRLAELATTKLDNLETSLRAHWWALVNIDATSPVVFIVDSAKRAVSSLASLVTTIGTDLSSAIHYLDMPDAEDIIDRAKKGGNSLSWLKGLIVWVQQAISDGAPAAEVEKADLRQQMAQNTVVDEVEELRELAASASRAHDICQGAPAKLAAFVAAVGPTVMGTCAERSAAVAASLRRLQQESGHLGGMPEESGLMDWLTKGDEHLRKMLAAFGLLPVGAGHYPTAEVLAKLKQAQQTANSFADGLQAAVDEANELINQPANAG